MNKATDLRLSQQYGETHRAFVTLDGLRGVAALAVSVRHAGFWTGEHPQQFFSKSYLAVDLFFVLSGFVIAYAYSRRLENGMPVWQFMRVRFIRLFPLYALAFAMAFPAACSEYASGLLSTSQLVLLFATISMLPVAIGGASLFPLNFPAWSLFFELIANLFFGLLYKRLSSIVLPLIVVCAALVLTEAVTWSWLGFDSEKEPMNAGVDWQSSGGGLVRVTFSFFAGVFTYRLWKSTPPAVLPPAIVVGALCAILIIPPLPINQKAFDLAAVLFCFPVIVFWGASCTPSPRVSQIFLFLGSASYAVYVLQWPVFRVTTAILSRLASEWIVLGMCNVIVITIIATIADKYFDVPVRAKLSKWIAQV